LFAIALEEVRWAFGERIMRLWNRILLAAALTCAYSTTLAFLFAVTVSGNYSPRTLLLPGVVPVALIGSTIGSILVTPIAVWAIRTGRRNLWLYGPILWVGLAAYIVFAIPRTGHYGPYGLLLLAVLGLVVLGFLPERQSEG
jgi:peptidoglycan/LPS O-acetylase OafA/YrhL